MEDKMARFTKKTKPYKEESKDTVKEATYKSLVAKIQTQVSQRRSLLKERPVPALQKDGLKSSVEKGTNIGQQGLLERFNITESKLSSINKSLLTRLSRPRGVQQEASYTSKDQNRPQSITSRDRSNLKERINKLSTLERNSKRSEPKTGLIGKQITVKDIPAVHSSGLSLLQKFQIYQLRNQGSDKSKSSKDGTGSFDLNGAMNHLQENPNRKFKNGLEKLKQRIAKLPGRELLANSSRDFAESGSKTASHIKGRQSYDQINVVEAQPISVNIYKKKVDPLLYKRDDQSSLRIMKARRSPTPVDQKKNNTMLAMTRIRIAEKTSMLD